MQKKVALVYQCRQKKGEDRCHEGGTTHEESLKGEVVEGGGAVKKRGLHRETDEKGISSGGRLATCRTSASQS